MTTKQVLAELKNTLIIGLIGFPIGLLWCGLCLESFEWTMKAGLFSAAIWIVMWQGNGLLSDYISKKIPWMENPGKRLLWGVIGIFVYTPTAMFLVNEFFVLIWDVSTGMTSSFSGFLNTAGIAIGITVVISLFINARAFFLSWRQAAINAEKLKRESLKSQFEALKAQINPHFLFNSLNVLTGLVYQDPDLSAKFIKQLSLVYRYLLENQNKELISIQEELDFLRSYIFLQKIRFGDNLCINIELSDNKNYNIPPLALQVLTENAIKHNEISEDHPLTIDITEKNGVIEVKNSKQLKNIPTQDSPGIGLKNLEDRYDFLINKKIQIHDDNDEFIVEIPKVDSAYESSHP